MGDRNERLETDVSFKRNDPDFLPNLFNLSLSLSLSLSTPRALPRIHNDDALDTENESEKKERRSASRRAKKRYPAAFLERLWFHAHSFRRDLKRRRRQERRRMVEASEKRTLSHDDAPKTRSSRLSSTTPAWRGCRKTNRTATCFVVVSFCGATEVGVIFKRGGRRKKNFMCMRVIP